MVPIPVLGSAVSPGFKGALSRFRLVTYDADSGQYGYRPLRGPEHPEGADIVRVVMLMHNGLKVSSKHSPSLRARMQPTEKERKSQRRRS